MDHPDLQNSILYGVEYDRLKDICTYLMHPLLDDNSALIALLFFRIHPPIDSMLSSPLRT